MSAADLLDAQAKADPQPSDIRPHLAALLLVRGMRLSQFRAGDQAALCDRDPSREMLAIADLVLEAAA